MKYIGNHYIYTMKYYHNNFPVNFFEKKIVSFWTLLYFCFVKFLRTIICGGHVVRAQRRSRVDWTSSSTFEGPVFVRGSTRVASLFWGDSPHVKGLERGGEGKSLSDSMSLRESGGGRVVWCFNDARSLARTIYKILGASRLPSGLNGAGSFHHLVPHCREKWCQKLNQYNVPDLGGQSVSQWLRMSDRNQRLNDTTPRKDRREAGWWQAGWWQVRKHGMAMTRKRGTQKWRG